MNLEQTDPWGLGISNLLVVVMQELATLDVDEIEEQPISEQQVLAKLWANRFKRVHMLGCIVDLRIRATASEVAEELREMQLTCKKIKDLLDKWNGGCQISGTAMETWLDALERHCYDIGDLLDSLRFGVFRGALRKAVELNLYLERASCGIERATAGHNYSNEFHSKESSAVPRYKSLLSDKTPLVYGTSRERDMHTIIEKLLSRDHPSRGVSIIGMDGLGKTSLARTILGHKAIIGNFDCILSASVSGHFQVEDVVRKLAAKHSETRLSNTESHGRDRLLEDLLDGKTILITLDDLWSVADEEWERFQYNYLGSCYSWKILTTTRNPRVAEVTASTSFYLSRMTNEDCVNLIMEKANMSSSDYKIWATDAELIAEKCKGMPVIANKFGFKLSKKRSLGERIDTIARIKNTNLSELPEFREVFPSLNLNEPKLPPHLKRCFAYFSLFSPDHKFNKDDLIQLWEAEGFVRPQDKIGWQPTGSECFDDLLSRSILQPLISSNEMELMYEIHEFNHEYANLLAGKAFFMNITEGTANFPSSCQNIRHLSLGCKYIDDLVLKQIAECKGLRTFLLQNQPMLKTPTSSLTFFPKLQSLRLLDLSHTNISKLPLLVSQLQHLRYLDLSSSNIQLLPEPIKPLRALQTLKLQNCHKLKRLPKDLNGLINLMHLYVDMNRLDHLPSKLGMLTNLATLSSFVVGTNEGNEIAELKNMKYLREILISGLQNVYDKIAAKESMLNTKHLLKRLVLEWDRELIMGNPERVLEGLEPHNELKELIVRNYRCQQFPSWLISPSRKLVSIHLENCYDCMVLPSFGQLPFLKTLALCSIHDVRIVDEQFCGQGEERFPSLESLEFCNMKRLAEWIGLESETMPCLRSLKLVDCPQLAYLPSLKHQSRLVNLEINNCPSLKAFPEVSSAIKGELGKSIIIDSPLAAKTCQVGEFSCLEIEGIIYSKGFPIKRTKTSSESLPNDKNKEFEEGKVKQPNPTSTPSPSSDICEDNEVMSQNLEIDPQHQVNQTKGASDEERLDKQKAEGEKNVHDSRASPSSQEVLQDSHIETPALTPLTRKDTDSAGLENQGYIDERMGEHVFEVEKKVECKSILFHFGVGYKFEKDMLIQMWMALGLLTKEPMEEIGAGYFEQLVSEGYMLCSDVVNSLYKVNTEKLNAELDMIREKQNYVILDDGARNDATSAETLYVSVFCENVDTSIFKTLGWFHKLRTLLFLGDYGSRLPQIPRDLFLCYEFLVTLYLSGTHITELPSSALKMINLRYLDLSWTFIGALPERIDRFKKLQTLKLQGCARLHRLPKEMKRLTELRHLHLDIRKLAAFPEGMGALVNIRTLSAFPVGTEEGLKISELKFLNNITGKFCISKMENVQSSDEAKEASLTAKRNIKKLELRWSDHQLQEKRNEDESILENLCPHSKLEEIQILCYPGTYFPNWIGDVSFDKLASITLFGCVDVAMLPSLEKLPSLVCLELISLNSVTKIDCKGEADHVAFRKLQKLAVDGMLNVQTWEKAQEGDYPSLVELIIKDCPKLLELPSLGYLYTLKHLEVSACTNLAFALEKELSTSLQQLIVEDCPLIEKGCLNELGKDWYKVKHVPTIWIDHVAIQIKCEDAKEVFTGDVY